MASADGSAVYQGLIARGLGPIQAAALTGNAQQESSFNPTAWNAQSGAGGLMQWRGPRLTGLEQYARSTNRSPGDLDTQLDYVAAELNGPESKAAQAINAATDIPSANAAVKGYLRYGPTEGGNRLQYSQAIANQNGGQTVAQATNGDTSAALDAIFSAPAATTQPSPDTTQALDSIFGASPLAGLKPGTPEYAAKIQALVNAGQPTPQPATPPPEYQPPADVVPAWARAFSNHAVESVPVLGPMLQNARNALVPAFGGQSVGEMDATDAAASAAAPGAALAGDVFGTVAPLAAAGGFIPGAARVLGMEGSLPARIMWGGLSGAALTGADSLARGAAPQQAAQNALVGGAVGGVSPVAGKVLGAGFHALMGQTGDQMVANAMRADANNPAATNALLQQTGPGATIADLGPNTKGLTAALASLPGEPKSVVVNNLTARATQTGARLKQDVAGTIGAGQPIGALVDQVTAAQKAAADPLYAAVRNQSVQVTPELQSIAATPSGQAALGSAIKTMQDLRQLPPGLPTGKLPQSAMTVQLLDYMKQALDDQAGAAVAANTKNAAMAPTRLAQQLTAEVDAQVPQYAAARAAFAGPAKVKDAIELGQSVFSNKTTPEDLQQSLNGMSPSERDGVLAGAQAAVQRAIGSARTNAAGAKSLFDSDFGKEKLAVLVGQDQADQIATALERERGFSDTSGKAYANSITSANAAQQKAISPSLAGFQQSGPPTANALGLTLAALDKARAAATGWYRNAQNLRAANLLTQPANPGLGPALANAGNALVAPASVPLLAKRQGVPLANALTWAGPAIDAMGNIPKVIVRGATPAP